MIFVMVITVWSLVAQVVAVVRASAASGWRLDTATLNAFICVLLLALVAVLVREAVRVVSVGPAAQTAVLE